VSATADCQLRSRRNNKVPFINVIGHVGQLRRHPFIFTASAEYFIFCARKKTTVLSFTISFLKEIRFSIFAKRFVV